MEKKTRTKGNVIVEDIKIGDIHYVNADSYRTVDEFVDLLDKKYMSIVSNNKNKWKELADKNGWIK